MQSGDGSALHTALLASGLQRADVVRLITQCLQDMGYARAADVLEQDSGVKCLSEPISRFRKAILRGDWCDRKLRAPANARTRAHSLA
jgi:BarA-like signal transduction histidine kinase